MRRALERAMAQTLRRHRGELDRMFREAVEQAMREVGPLPPRDGRGKGEAFGRMHSPGQWERGPFADGSSGWMAWRRWHDRGPDGPGGVCPFCPGECRRRPVEGPPGVCPFCHGKYGRPSVDGPRVWKWRGYEEPKGERSMGRFDKDRDGGFCPGECKNKPERSKKMDRDREGKGDRRALKDSPRWEKKDRRHEDDPPDEDED